MKQISEVSFTRLNFESRKRYFTRTAEQNYADYKALPASMQIKDDPIKSGAW